MMNVFGSLSLFVLIWIGIAVLWAERVAYHGARTSVDDPIRLMLKIGGWVLIILGILGTEFQLMVFLSPFAWGVTIAILIVAFVRYRTGERRALIACLAAAAEHQIPLELAARAFAKERTDDMGMRATRLARLLESGVPLSNALSQTWMFLPYDVLLAVRLGDETGDVSGAVKKVARTDHEAESLLRSILEKLFYLVVLTNVLIGILTFIMLKIVPVFAKMFDEFGIDLPGPTQALINISNWIANYWFLVAPLILPLNAILVVGGLYYVYLLPRDIPLLNRVSLRWDSALIMRSLGLAVRQQRPFLNMIRILSERYPRGSVRKRLRQALVHLNNGEPWTEALYRTGLLRWVDAAVLSAAQRSGNLEWALEEMAESGARRITYRLRVLLNLAYPTVSFTYGLVIAFVVVSLFIPLVALIQGLT